MESLMYSPILEGIFGVWQYVCIGLLVGLIIFFIMYRKRQM